MLLPSSVYRSDPMAISDDRFRIGLGRVQVPAAIDALDAHPVPELEDLSFVT